jgi:hypothetical protein
MQVLMPKIRFSLFCRMDKIFSIEKPIKGINLIEVFGSVNYGTEKGVFPVIIDGLLHTFRMHGNALWVFGNLSKTLHPEIVTLVGGLIESTLI